MNGTENNDKTIKTKKQCSLQTVSCFWGVILEVSWIFGFEFGDLVHQKKNK